MEVAGEAGRQEADGREGVGVTGQGAQGQSSPAGAAGLVEAHGPFGSVGCPPRRAL